MNLSCRAQRGLRDDELHDIGGPENLAHEILFMKKIYKSLRPQTKKVHIRWWARARLNGSYEFELALSEQDIGDMLCALYGGRPLNDLARLMNKSRRRVNA